jgi:hypothetical protein
MASIPNPDPTAKETICTSLATPSGESMAATYGRATRRAAKVEEAARYNERPRQPAEGLVPGIGATSP